MKNIILLVVVFANVCLMASVSRAYKAAAEIAATNARYTNYLQCLTHGKPFVMDARDAWLVSSNASNVRFSTKRPGHSL